MNHLKEASIWILCLICPLLSLIPGTGFSFETNFKAYTLMETTGPADSDRNPGNRLARIPDYAALGVLKADVSKTFEKWRLSARPRIKMEWQQADIGGKDENDSNATVEIMEFEALHMLSNDLFASYGWENLQWGPGFLYSPSNPFFRDNGKKDLIQDFEGKGIAKLVFVKDFSWTFSLLCNTDHGAVNEPDFEKIHALKIDYSADQGYASAVLSYKDHGQAELGLYAGLTATDALIIYGEGSFQKGSDILLAGAGYTFESGNTLTLEYLYYGYGTKLPGRSAGSGADFLRRNYLLAQYLNDEIIPDLDLVCRITYCLDDGASRLYTSLSYNLNDHIELKAAAMVNTGGPDRSFAAFMDYQTQAALEYTY